MSHDKIEEREEKRSVLIVDDQPNYIHALARIIRDEYRILAATSGEKALEVALSDNPPDLILLDIMMPEMDGYEVCRRLKQNEQSKDIPVIFATTQETPEDEEIGFKLGAADYIYKPFNPTATRVRIKTHMELKRKTELLEKLRLGES